MANYYVDINDSYTTSGTGSLSSKFTFTQFVSTLTTSHTNDTFYLVGTLTGGPDLYADFRQDSLSGLSVHKKVVSYNKFQPASMKIKYLVGGHYDNSFDPDFNDVTFTSYSHVVEFQDIIIDTSGIDIEIPTKSFQNIIGKTYEEVIHLYYPHIEYDNGQYVGACGGFIFNNCHIKISGGINGQHLGDRGLCGIIYHPGSMIQFINSNIILNDNLALVGEADYGDNSWRGGWSLLTISKCIFSSTSNVNPLIPFHYDRSRLYVKCYGNVYDSVTSAYSTNAALVENVPYYGYYDFQSWGIFLTDEYGQVLSARPSLFSSAISAINSSAVNYITSEFSAINVAGYGYDVSALGNFADRTVYVDGYRDGPGFLYFPQVSDTTLSATLDITSATSSVDGPYITIIGNDPTDLFSGSEAKVTLNVNSDVYSKYGIKYLVFFDFVSGGYDTNYNKFFNRLQTTSATSALFTYNGSLLSTPSTYDTMGIQVGVYPKNSYISPTSANNFLSDLYIADGGMIEFSFKRPLDPHPFSIRTLSGTEYTDIFEIDDTVTLKIFDFASDSPINKTSIVWGDGTSTVISDVPTSYDHKYYTSGNYTIDCYLTDSDGYTYTTTSAGVLVTNEINTILYVDLAGSTSGVGTVDDPIGGEQFLDVINTGVVGTTSINSRQIFKLRGSMHVQMGYALGSSTPLQVKSGSRYMFDVWSASSYGPWVIEFYDPRPAGGRLIGDFTGTTLRGGIIFNIVDSDNRCGVKYNFTKLYTMYIVCQGENSSVHIITDSRNTSDDESYAIGSTIYSPNGIVVS